MTFYEENNSSSHTCREQNQAAFKASAESLQGSFDPRSISEISDWDNPIFLGALPYNEDESIVEREIWPLYLGDKIYTYTADYNFNTGESVLYHSYDPITVDDYFFNTPGLMDAEFDGTFELIVEVCDFSGNCVISEPIGPYIPVAPLEN